MSAPPLGRVAIIGGGVEAWMTAAGLARATGGQAAIRVVETGPVMTGALSTLPSLRSFHTLLGLADRPQDGCAVINTVFDEHIAHVNERIKELGNLKLQLQALRARCHSEQGVDACGILQGLAAMETTAKPERHTHLG